MTDEVARSLTNVRAAIRVCIDIVDRVDAALAGAERAAEPDIDMAAVAARIAQGSTA